MNNVAGAGSERWRAVRVGVVMMGLMVSGCDRSIDAVEASRLLVEGGIAGKPVLCPTPLERRGFKQWFWTGQRLPSLAYGSSAEQCVRTVRDHGIARRPDYGRRRGAFLPYQQRRNHRAHSRVDRSP